MRRVHHPTVPDVDADMAEPEEEEQVAGLHSRGRHRASVVVERVGAVRELDAEASICPVDEARAVEPARGRDPAPSIRDADFSDGKGCRAFPDRARRSARDRRVAGSGRVRHLSEAREDERGKCERLQTAANGGRQRGGRERLAG